MSHSLHAVCSRGAIVASAANNNRFNFSVGSLLSKSKQQGKQHQRKGSAGALSAAKAAVTRAASGGTVLARTDPLARH